VRAVQRRSQLWFLVLAFLWLEAACSAPSPSDPTQPAGTSDASSTDAELAGGEPVHVQVAHNAAWVLGTSETDPFPLRPEGARCGSESFVLEEIDTGLWYDILTDECDHATVHQTTLAELQEGDTLLVWVWHYAMDHQGGDFNAQVALGTPPHVVWQTTLPVPAESGLIYEEITLNASWPAGSPIWFHLSNHGVNTWSLVELARIDAP
jgi:hypothetical protein